MLLSTDLRDLSLEQLEAKLAELRDERSKLRFRSATEAIENPMRFRTVRRDIARVLTILGEKRREA
ncbi:MAG: 50S ribosomal protein L29 [Gemmatimonadales bacterium]|jgi:large subunit ribosomal protein L29|nr:50S ribosomal protein L29 [Gemmatimonadales bacterium]MDZ4257940.1 50S ribosomal protein L29 [Gemmatimonadales bacterium]MDZ4388251.1 50S ribosomal protein L29 [Gemmatimonadales bacterium]